MAWNWQQTDWPRFRWDSARLARAEEAFLVSGGVLAGVVEHLDEADRDTLRVQLIAGDAADTSEIEGEILDRASVQSSLQRQLGLVGPADGHPRVRPGEAGIAGLMVDLYRSFAEPLTHERLWAWHGLLMSGGRDLADVGRYRNDPRPMQIISGRIDRPVVHFEAVPTARVDAEMNHFVGWFARTAPGGADPLPALTRAGIAHLHFESIHPFEDGNGRLGRAVSEMALAHGLGRPVITALASTILVRKREYYAALADASRTNELTEWLAWFAGIAIEAQQRTLARAQFLVDVLRVLVRVRGQLNDRQDKALYRMVREGPGGFTGGMSAGKYVSLTGTTQITARRDLAELVELTVLNRTGERRGTRYHLSILPRPVGRVLVDQDGRVVSGSP